MNNLSRREGESSLDHHKRLVLGKLVNKTLSDVDYTELSEEVYGRSYASDVCRRMMYGSRHTLDLLEEERTRDISENDILKKIEEEQREIHKERMKLQTEKTEYYKFLREISRAELFEEKVINAIRDNIIPLKTPKREVIKRDNKKAGVLAFGDIHFGKEILIKDLKGNVINEFNEEIFELRMWKILNEAVDRLERDNIKHVHIFNIGDAIEGILRNGSQLMSLKYGIVDSTIKFVNFIANWLNELSEYVDVTYYQSSANHEDLRIVTGKKGDFPHENMARMMTWALKSILKDNPHIEIEEEQIQGLTYAKVLNFDILAVHGDKERKLENSIKDYTALYGENIDYLLVGHKHFNNVSNVSIGKYIFQVPSVCGIDNYSMSLKKSSDAGCKLLIFEEGIGHTIDYNIKLN